MFEAFPNLRILQLDNTSVTDAGLKSVAGLTRLVDLRLSHTQITDAGLKHIRGTGPALQPGRFGDEDH